MYINYDTSIEVENYVLYTITLVPLSDELSAGNYDLVITSTFVLENDDTIVSSDTDDGDFVPTCHNSKNTYQGTGENLSSAFQAISLLIMRYAFHVIYIF